MWQDLFRRQSTVSRLAEGPWGPHLEEFVAGLVRDRYSVETMRRSLCAADHFGRWLLAQDLALYDVDDQKIEN